ISATTEFSGALLKFLRREATPESLPGTLQNRAASRRKADSLHFLLVSDSQESDCCVRELAVLHDVHSGEIEETELKKGAERAALVYHWHPQIEASLCETKDQY
ncbi:hypothetical protein AVEN_606-1, partial [Araneus ventricosus]